MNNVYYVFSSVTVFFDQKYSTYSSKLNKIAVEFALTNKLNAVKLDLQILNYHLQILKVSYWNLNFLNFRVIIWVLILMTLR